MPSRSGHRLSKRGIAVSAHVLSRVSLLSLNVGPHFLRVVRLTRPFSCGQACPLKAGKSSRADRLTAYDPLRCGGRSLDRFWRRQYGCRSRQFPGDHPLMRPFLRRAEVRLRAEYRVQGHDLARFFIEQGVAAAMGDLAVGHIACLVDRDDETDCSLLTRGERLCRVELLENFPNSRRCELLAHSGCWQRPERPQPGLLQAKGFERTLLSPPLKSRAFRLARRRASKRTNQGEFEEPNRSNGSISDEVPPLLLPVPLVREGQRIEVSG